MTSPAPALLPPLSPLATAEGTLFRVLANAPRGLSLLLYDDAAARRPARALPLEPSTHRHGDVWEVFVPGVGAGQHYLWALDPARPLLDPYALSVSGPPSFGADGPPRPRPPRAERNRDAEFKSIVVLPPPALPTASPRRPWGETILYELHVRGFTRHGSSGVSAPGTYRGLGSKAAYLADLGVTAVELLPVHEFDETERPPGAHLFNLWGYSPVSWFAPNRRYAADAALAEGPIAEFREMVETFHAAGIEVLVDVVFNHTAEMGVHGPTLSLRGLDADLYYLRDPASGEYANHSGCGNTVRAQHPTVRALLRNALRWWRRALGVDGFRFDLAAALCRDERGELTREPPLIREIETDPWLAGCRLIAEPWDASGAHLVEHWPGNRSWSVWNDRFRDDVRRAWLADLHYAGALASRLSGSSDLLRGTPLRGINYVTCHDGFTLLDCVSYERRHNAPNGEGGTDGFAHEISANHGEEGPAHLPSVRRAREQARRNLMASLLLAQGVPMILGGDEMGRTQRGNNNAYCQDNEVSWIDWQGIERDAGFHRFVKGLIAFRRSTELLRRGDFLLGESSPLRPGSAPDVRWIGPAGKWVDWEADPGHFGYVLSGDPAASGAERAEPDLLVLVNLLPAAREYRLPPDRHGAAEWRLVLDTARLPPEDFHEPGSAPRWTEDFYPVQGRSLALLQAADVTSSTS